MVLRVILIEKVTFKQKYQEDEEIISGGRAYKEEGTAHKNILRRQHVWHVLEQQRG